MREPHVEAMESAEVRVADEGDLAALIADFESCRLPYAAWKQHRTHLIVSLGILRSAGLARGTERIRSGIQRFNAHQGIPTTPDSGYHETLTIAFVRLIAKHLEDHAQLPLPDLIASLVSDLGDKRVLLRHYSRERIMSTEARMSWMNPDLVALPALATEDVI